MFTHNFVCCLAGDGDWLTVVVVFEAKTPFCIFLTPIFWRNFA